MNKKRPAENPENSTTPATTSPSEEIRAATVAELRIHHVCTRENGSFVPVAELKLTPREKSEVAFRRWLEREGKPGQKYVCIQVVSPMAHIEEVVQRKLVGF